MNVTLINPLHPGKEDVPPIDLLRLSATMPARYRQTLLDGNVGDVIDGVSVSGADAIVLHGRSVKSYKTMKNLASYIRGFSSAPIIVVGGVCAAKSTLLERTAVNYAIRGDAENALLLLDGIARGRLEESDRISVAPTADYTADIDSLPFPAYGLINYEGYFLRLSDVRRPAYNAHASRGSNLRSIEVFTSRGCEGTCTFCEQRQTGRRAHSVDYVVEQLRWLREEYNVGAVDFGDASFTADRGRAILLAEQLQRFEVPFLFRIFGARTDEVDRDLLCALRNAGCVSIYFGIESMEQPVLDAVAKGTTVEQNMDALNWAREMGIDAPVQLIYGLSPSWGRDIEQTVRTLSACGFEPGPEKTRLALPIPGTPLYASFRRSGFIHDEEEYLLSISDLPTANPWASPFILGEGV